MKISRIALLSVGLFLGQYMLASENNTPSTVDKIVDAAEIKAAHVDAKLAKIDLSSLLVKIGALIGAPIVFAGDIADKIANKTYLNSAIATVTNTKLLKNTRLNRPELIGKLMVIAFAAGITYKLYDMYVAQNEDNDDELIFESEYDDNN